MKLYQEGLPILETSQDMVNRAMQLLGSDVKGRTVGVTLPMQNTALTLTDAVQRLTAVYVPKTNVISGVRFYTRQQGSFTADAENSLSLYSYLAGTLTEVATSANDGNIWKGTANTWINVPFTTPYEAVENVYFVGALYNNSAEVTAPQITSVPNLLNAAQYSPGFTNSAKLSGTVSAQSAQAASIAMSGVTAVISLAYFELY